MNVSVSKAKGQLTDLVRRAESGEEVVLTRHGREAARLVAATPRTSVARRRKAIEEAQTMAAAAREGLASADSRSAQDALYDERGLPA